MTRPALAITLGDPRGIGPEIVRTALATPEVAGAARFVVVGPEGAGVPVDEAVGRWDGGTGASGTDAAGRARDAAAGRLAGLAIERAVALARAGTVDGIVTAPIDKAALHAGGYPDPGHTELLERLTGAPTTMMLASDRLRVVLATTHLALREVPAAVTEAALVRAIRATREGLRAWFGIEAPRLVLCALNPHAGDQGRFGVEDDALLAPVARAEGIAGPLPADTVFVRALRGEFDAVIAPYHDVGMTAIKVASFGEAVNVTLGLPFPRTSPDHGTALDIAGKGTASATSMVAAIRLALAISRRAVRSTATGSAGLPSTGR
ncbi:MAG: 4-hydroxythreonine-4-phosphate dehydrogenase PdxA [Gemmatimonadetes bacterium]|nr:4-hydroxythreonine-4-phosphate dehydrogenase PdxA [Gemmatimonadota bacterium]